MKFSGMGKHVLVVVIQHIYLHGTVTIVSEVSIVQVFLQLWWTLNMTFFLFCDIHSRSFSIPFNMCIK